MLGGNKKIVEEKCNVECWARDNPIKILGTKNKEQTLKIRALLESLWGGVKIPTREDKLLIVEKHEARGDYCSYNSLVGTNVLVPTIFPSVQIIKCLV